MREKFLRFTAWIAAAIMILTAVCGCRATAEGTAPEPPAIYGTYTFDKDAPEEIRISADLNGQKIISVTQGTRLLESGTDYTYADSVIVLSESVFSSASAGETLDFTLTTAGGSASFTVAVAGQEELPEEEGDIEGMQAVRKLLQYKEYKTGENGSEYFEPEAAYRNRLDTLAADPCVIYIEEGDQAGYFYMYATSDKLGAKGYLCHRSKDLQNWEEVGTAYAPTYFKEGGKTYSSFAVSNYWAPEVIYDREQKLYYLFYSASYIGKGLMFYLDCAVSKDPQGPFVQYAVHIRNLQPSDGQTEKERENLRFWQGKLAPYEDGEAAEALDEQDLMVFPPLIDFRNMRVQKAGETDADYLGLASADGYMKVIDASPFIDPVTGGKYLYFVRDLGENGGNDVVFNRSAVAVLALDEDWRPKLDENKKYADVRLLTDAQRAAVGGEEDASLGEGKVNEGPFMLYNEQSKKYYLLFSCNSYWEKAYAVHIAVSDSPTGPFTKLARDEGGWLLYAESDWSWMSGTGHNTVTEKDGKQFIVYHAHTDRETGNSLRAVAIDELVWIKNADGLLIPHVNGPSYGYMPQTAGEWSNIASEASVSASNVRAGSAVQDLCDGAVKLHDDGVLSECVFGTGDVKVTITFKDYRQVRALFVFNSFDGEKALDTIQSAEFYCRDEKTGKKYIAYTDTLAFDRNRYKKDGEYIPGGSFAIGFDTIYVNKIVIRLPQENYERAISEIMILGK